MIYLKKKNMEYIADQYSNYRKKFKKIHLDTKLLEKFKIEILSYGESFIKFKALGFEIYANLTLKEHNSDLVGQITLHEKESDHHMLSDNFLFLSYIYFNEHSFLEISSTNQPRPFDNKFVYKFWFIFFDILLKEKKIKLH